MSTDEIRRLRDEYESALDEAEEKRAAYHAAIRKLHHSGVPLRQIAEQLGISHQRVHQIVGEGPPPRTSRRRIAGVVGALILLGLALVAWQVLVSGGRPGLKSRSHHSALTVRVVAAQGSWRFGYDRLGHPAKGATPPNMVIPAGRRVRVILTSRDVVHAFFVPALHLKLDAIPGSKNESDIMVRTAGLYSGTDAEPPSRDSSGSFVVRALSPKPFARWIRLAGSNAHTS
jgi:heme/copper-type cytochrome/quinol oxidase subunit 2